MSKPALFLEHYFPGYRTYLRFFLAFKGPIWYHINMENSIYNIDFSGLTYGRGVATGCNRTPDRYSWESRPLKKGIQTGGKKDLNNYIAPYNG